MNKLDLTQLGGFVPKADDFDFIQQGVINAFKGILSAFNIVATESYKLSGCVVTIAGGNATWTAGYIVIHGEVCYVPAGNFAYAGADSGLCWVLNDAASPTLDPVIFNNDNNNNIHHIRTGVLQIYAAQPDYILDSVIRNIAPPCAQYCNVGTPSDTNDFGPGEMGLAAGENRIQFVVRNDPNNLWNAGQYHYAPNRAGYYRVTFRLMFLPGFTGTMSLNLSFTTSADKVIARKMAATYDVIYSFEGSAIFFFNNTTDTSVGLNFNNGSGGGCAVDNADIVFEFIGN